MLVLTPVFQNSQTSDRSLQQSLLSDIRSWRPRFGAVVSYSRFAEKKNRWSEWSYWSLEAHTILYIVSWIFANFVLFIYIVVIKVLLFEFYFVSNLRPAAQHLPYLEEERPCPLVYARSMSQRCCMMNHGVFTFSFPASNFVLFKLFMT